VGGRLPQPHLGFRRWRGGRGQNMPHTASGSLGFSSTRTFTDTPRSRALRWRAWKVRTMDMPKSVVVSGAAVKQMAPIMLRAS
jgi:hypothetical protein